MDVELSQVFVRIWKPLYKRKTFPTIGRRITALNQHFLPSNKLFGKEISIFSKIKSQKTSKQENIQNLFALFVC